MTQFSLPSLPTELLWQISPLEWAVDAQHNLTTVAGRQTDWFVDPGGSISIDNAPCALFLPPDDEFRLSAQVSVEFASTFDAGVLQIRAADRAEIGAKLCFEYSPQGQPMIVSVVTRGVSDDCNSVPIEGQTVYLRVTRQKAAIAFHYSLDGAYWHFVRHFSLGVTGPVRVGFSAQSPTGTQCQAQFAAIHYQAGGLKDLRNGE
jgi:hypothetical protein